MTTFLDVKRHIHSIIHVESEAVIDILFGTVVASQIPGDAICLYLVGPPSSGKTELIRAFQDYPHAYSLSSLTPNTFVSGFSNRKGETSLLLRLTSHGINLIFLKDFTSVLSMRAEVRSEITSQVREIIDGYYVKATGGEKGSIVWRGKMSFIAGVTKAVERDSEVTTTMGERFLFTRMAVNHPIDSITKAMSIAGQEDTLRSSLTSSTASFLASLDYTLTVSIPEDIIRRIKAASILLTMMRCHVSRSHRGTINYIPEAEGPARIGKQLLQIGRGISILHQAPVLTSETCNLLIQIVSDSMPSLRSDIVRYLWINHGPSGEATTHEIADSIGKPRQTIFHILEDMEIVDILQLRQDLTTYNWRLSPIVIHLIRDSLLL